jgi:asparagine synthase (glutamine-hydrolysing)
MSDVPLGAFLSGGVDSSSVVGIMAEASAQPVQTFSIGFSDKQYDELPYARAVASRHKTQHFERVVTPWMHEMLPQLARYYDEPFADSSSIPTLYLARLAREGVKVALSGDGADEVFGGYRKYFKCVFEARVRGLVPDAIRRPVFSTASRYYPAFTSLPRIFQSRMLLANLGQDTVSAYFNTMSTFGAAEALRVLNPDIRADVDGYLPSDLFVEKFRAVQHLAPLEQFQYVDMESYLPGDILVKVDRATMAYSLESRAPWLDHRLVEFAGALPPSFKLRRNSGKLILKSAMSPYLPGEVIRRMKMGFGVPLAKWFRSSLRQVFEDVAFGRDTTDYFDLMFLRRLWAEHLSESADHSRKLWAVLAFGIWNRYHCCGGDIEGLTEMSGISAARAQTE